MKGSGDKEWSGKMIRIGVIGQSGQLEQEILDIAEAIGKEIASRGAVLLTGGTNGVMEAASKGAKVAGGLVIGILPGDTTDVANDYVDIPITTGFGFDYRSMVLVHSSDAIIMIGGGIGTLVELSEAYMQHKPVIVVESSGGWAARVKEIAYEGLYLDHRRENYPLQVDFSSDAKEALDIAYARIEENKQKTTNGTNANKASRIDG
jgi:uncharacterized protein (TIGR00725 family)